MRPYSQGLVKIRAFDALSARELLSQAVAADPSFPLAHSELARTWSFLGYDIKAQQEAKKALDGANNLSREKHLVVEARFYETSKDWGKAILKPIRLSSVFSPTISTTACNWQMRRLPGGRGKDALKSLAALEALGVQANHDPRIDLARSEAAASLGDEKTQARYRRARGTRSRRTGCQTPGGSRARPRVPGFGGPWRKRKGKKYLRRSETNLRRRGETAAV